MKRMIKYRLIYWPHSGNLAADWYQDDAIRKSIEKEYEFNASSDTAAATMAYGIFMKTNTDGVSLSRWTMNSNCEWEWQDVCDGKVDYTS